MDFKKKYLKYKLKYLQLKNHLGGKNDINKVILRNYDSGEDEEDTSQIIEKNDIVGINEYMDDEDDDYDPEYDNRKGVVKDFELINNQWIIKVILKWKGNYEPKIVKFSKDKIKFLSRNQNEKQKIINESEYYHLGRQGFEPLFIAIQKNRLEDVKNMIKDKEKFITDELAISGIVLDAEFTTKKPLSYKVLTGLAVAINCGHIEIIKYLLNLDDVDITKLRADHSRNTYFHYAYANYLNKSDQTKENIIKMLKQHRTFKEESLKYKNSKGHTYDYYKNRGYDLPNEGTRY